MQQESSFGVGLAPASSNLKERQRSKIAEIRAALVETGHVALDEQVTALGLPRSTACSILKRRHKSSGLSADTIGRILRSPRLPGLVRQRTLEYMREKIEGHYGHTERRRREFAKCLMVALRNEFKIERARHSNADAQKTHGEQVQRTA